MSVKTFSVSLATIAMSVFAAPTTSVLASTSHSQANAPLAYASHSQSVSYNAAHITAQIIPLSASGPEESTQTTECSCTYIVQSGDTLSKIAPTNWQSISVPSGNPNVIYPGDTINLCPDTSQPTQSTNTTEPTQSQPQQYAPPVTYTGKGPNTYPWGWCTFGAEELASRDLNGLGNAIDWAYNAAARGIPTGYVPAVGATAVFGYGSFGSPQYTWYTGPMGHVAHVLAVGDNGSFQIQEMNFNNNFGGWTVRWVYNGPNITFIY